MYTSTLLLSALATLASSAPTPAASTSSTALGNYFHITNFVFGCTTTCDWSYDVTIANSSTYHPSGGPVHCKGSQNVVTDFSAGYAACDALSDDQRISTYISKDSYIQLEYQYHTADGAVYWYDGNSSVNAATSGRPQATDFYVEELTARAVA